MRNAQLNCQDVALILEAARQNLAAIERLIAAGTADDLKRAGLIARYRHATFIAAKDLHRCERRSCRHD